jgi:hypothetical protein
MIGGLSLHDISKCGAHHVTKRLLTVCGVRIPLLRFFACTKAPHHLGIAELLVPKFQL